MSAEFDQLVSEFERFQSKLRRIDDKFADVDRLQEEVTALAASACSPSRSVTVIAGPGGAIKDIKLSAEALRQQPGALSAEIMSTLHQAVAEVARKQAAIVERHLGDDLGLVERVLETQAQVFGTTVEELRSNLEDTPTERSHPTGPAPRSSGGDSPGDAFLNTLFADGEDDQEGR